MPGKPCPFDQRLGRRAGGVVLEGGDIRPGGSQAVVDTAWELPRGSDGRYYGQPIRLMNTSHMASR
jgi:hypothetical protein